MINSDYSNIDCESPSEYIKVFRDIERGRFEELRHLNISYMSSYTAQVLEPYIVTEMAKRNYKVSLYFPPYNTFEQEILDKESGLFGSNPSVIMVHYRIEDIDENLSNNFYSFTESELNNNKINILKRIQSILDKLKSRFDGNIIVYNFSFSEHSSIHIHDPMLSYSQDRFISELNYELSCICKHIPSCYIFDYYQTVRFIGYKNWVDLKLLLLARIPFSTKSQIAIGKMLSKTIVASLETPCKCIVLDLDNTLWGGVIGEDGVSNIQFSDEFPGVAFKRFQQTILNLYNQGVLLAVSSKNDEKLVIDAFSKRKDFIIKLEYFSVLKINWKNKADNILEISQELNIGLNSIVFFDDSYYERGLVRNKLPDVHVVNVPENPVDYSLALASHEFFDYLHLTEEDKSRNKYYSSDKKRISLSHKSNSINDFLATLNMKAVIGTASDATIARISQLTIKTNQFNLTTKRYSVSAIEKMINEGALVLWLSVEDNFGDIGVVGVAIASNNNANNWYIDTFLLSCRAIGRKLEHVLLNTLLDKIKKNKGLLVFGEYIETDKNEQVSSFYDNNGFVKESDCLWKKDLSLWNIDSPNFIELRVL